MREVANAICYVLRGGIAWRLMPEAFPPLTNKTDRNDAHGIAQIMRTGWYRAAHVKSVSCRSWRALLTARRMVLNKLRDVENGLRAWSCPLGWCRSCG
jgi:transposase